MKLVTKAKREEKLQKHKKERVTKDKERVTKELQKSYKTTVTKSQLQNLTDAPQINANDREAFRKELNSVIP